MNRATYEEAVQQEIEQAVLDFLPDSGLVPEHRFRLALKRVADAIGTARRVYELDGLRTADELAEEWGVSRRRAQAFIATQHERWGTGKKIGNTWVLSADEAEQYHPGPPGRPRRT